jgi:hypothetical protein
MAHEVFISYSSKNKPVADAVCARLEFHKIRCWIAPRDVLPGSNWGAAIIDAIGGSRIVVLVFSSEANTSDAVRRELERATSSSKIIIPFRLEDIRISKELEFFIAGSHWLDAFTPPLEDHIDRLAGAINGFLKGEAWSSSEPNRAAAGERPGGIFQKVWTESWKRVLSVGPRSKNAPTDFWKWLFGGDAKPPAIVNHIMIVALVVVVLWVIIFERDNLMRALTAPDSSARTTASPHSDISDSPSPTLHHRKYHQATTE